MADHEIPLGGWGVAIKCGRRLPMSNGRPTYVGLLYILQNLGGGGGEDS